MMKYKWVSDGARYRPDMNKERPWAVEYETVNDHYGFSFFVNLDEALEFIGACDMEFPF